MLVNKVSDDAYQWNGHDVVISIDGVFFYRTLWAFSELVAAISAALHETFVLSKYANSVSQFSGLEITAGQRTMSGLIVDLTGQTFVLPVMLTGQNSILLKMK